MVAWVVVDRRHLRHDGPFALPPSTPLFPLPHLSPLFPTPYGHSYTTAAPQPLCNQSVTQSFCRDGGCTPSVPRKEQEMTIEASKPNSIKHPRCRQFTADGTRCRLAVLDNRTNLCFRHSALDINKFLARLVVLVTKGRISPRRASVLAYITNQLLHSHRAIDRENLLQ